MYKLTLGPILCDGDLKEILFAHDKRCSRVRNPGHVEAFRQVLDECDLDDIDYVGDPSI